MAVELGEYGIAPRYFTWRGLLRENDQIRQRICREPGLPVPRPPAPVPAAPVAAGAGNAVEQALRWGLHLLEDTMELLVGLGLGLVTNGASLVGSLLPWCAVAICCHALIARLAGRAMGDLLR